MKTLIIIIGIVITGIVRAQVNTYPYTQSFEDDFTYGQKVYFLPNWWGNYVSPDSMGQYNEYANTGNHSLYMVPEGEEFKTIAQVKLDLTDQYNTFAEFWVATKKNGAPEDQKRVKLNVAVSYDNGITFPFVTRFGPHEGFPNENTSFEKFVFPFPPATNNQSGVVLRFIGKSGGGPHLPTILLLDDVSVMQAALDTFPPFIMGEELAINVVNSITIPFSEPLQADSAVLATHYNFTWPEEEDGNEAIGEGPLPGVANVALSADGYSITLALDPPLTIGETYALEMYHLTDLNGNVADTLVMDNIVYNIPSPGSLVFSEVLFADPSPVFPKDKLQYIEIYNPTTETIPLGGLRIKGAVSAHDLPNVKLKPGEYWVATRNAESYYATFGKQAWEWKGSWIEFEAEEGETLEPQSLYIQTTNRHGGELVDSIGFDFSDPAWSALKQLGYAVEVCNKHSDNLDVNNWTLAGGEPYTYTVEGYDYTVYATPGSGCFGSNAPVVDLGEDGARCGATAITLDARNEGSKYLWSTGEETQSITITQSGSYSVLVNNGVDVASDSIIVSLVPDITALPGEIPESACAATEVHFTDNTADAVGWIWLFGDQAISTDKDPVHQYAEAGTYHIKLVALNGFGCADTVSTDILIHPNQAGLIIPSLACENTAVNFEDSSIAGTSWTWSFDDGATSTDQNPSHTYTASGTYHVSLTTSNEFGCTHTTSEELVVNPNNADWNVPSLLCEQVEAVFADQSPSAISWAWDFGDGAVASSKMPVHIFANDGTYSVRLKATNSFGCSSTSVKQVTVRPNNVEWQLPNPICEQVEATFGDKSPSAMAWSWDFGDGSSSSQQNPSKMYAGDGTYNISLAVTNSYGCSNAISQKVAVNPNEPDWIVSPEPACTYSAITFTDNSLAGSNWLWDFGDGTSATGQQTQHTYTSPGEYIMQLTVTNAFGCTNMISQPIPVDICVGVEDVITENSIMFYPNPTDGKLSLQLSEQPQYPGIVQVMTLTGKIVYTHPVQIENGRVQSLDLSTLDNGVYLLKLFTDHRSATGRLMISK